tara:strand:- start:593 stop:730 length:138 start_codon:yes stop_codon:yes gene_type:complete
MSGIKGIDIEELGITIGHQLRSMVFELQELNETMKEMIKIWKDMK